MTLSYAPCIPSSQCPTLYSPSQALASSTPYSLTPVPFSTYPFNPYPAYITQYNNQQYATQHMTKVISPDDTAVFVSDGQSWKEYNLEKVFSW